MIDIDKYEGHTKGPWEVNNPDDDESLIFSVGALKFVSSANTQLIADSPLLLEEVKSLFEENKRLREEIERIAGITNGYVGPTKAWAEHITKDLLAVIK